MLRKYSLENKLALFGGSPVRKKPYPFHRTTGKDEMRRVRKVLRKGLLSEFEGTNNRYFLGGPEVRALEKEWAKKCEVKYAVSFNSATSALFAAVGATGAGPGDEVIVTPYTMSATATAIIGYNAIPIFGDVELNHFNLDPENIIKKITSRTKAILVAHIFGHPADMQPIMDIARKRKLMVLEDAAQSLGAKYKNRMTGTIGDIGVYSLNCNKIIQCGEGGIAVTNNKTLALKLQLIRNHAEAVIASGLRVKSLVNMLGWNYRMTELEAAIARSQLHKLDHLFQARVRLANYLNQALIGLEGVAIPLPAENCTHAYYRYALKIDYDKLKIDAKLLVRALNAEGMDFYVSYMKPLYLQPLYQSKLAFGDKHCPFDCPLYKGKVDYSAGICPNVEKLEKIIVSTEIVRPPQTIKDMQEIALAIRKVLSNRKELQKDCIYEKS